MYYLCSEIKDSYCTADLSLCFHICKLLVFTYANCWFSDEGACCFLYRRI